VTIDVTCAGSYVLVIRSSLPVSAGALTGGDITPTNGVFYAGSRATVARSIDGIDGSSAIIGFIDTGIDFANQDFRFDALPNNTRLFSIWDQTLAKETDEFTPTDFAYGVEYTELQINNHLNGTLPAYIRHVDTGGHGTSVAGVAAGDGSNDGAGVGFKGVAPGARLIMVKSTLSSKAVIDGIAYLKARAASYNMPLVINISLGTQDGPHDGSSLLDKAVDAVTGPGLAIVVAAGNDGFGPTGAETIHDQMTRAIFTSGIFTYDPIDTATSDPGLANHIVISEFQASLAGAQFVELYNPTDTPTALGAWTLQFKIEVGGGYAPMATFPAGASIPPFGYYLVGLAGMVPPPDTVSTMMGAAGTSGGNLLLANESGVTIDKVGYGGFADDAETVPTGTPASGNSQERLPGAATTTGNGTDTDDNSADFIGRAIPQPQNTTSTEVPGKPHIIDIWASPTDQYAITVTDGTASGTFSAADGTSASIIPLLPNREYVIDDRIDSPSNGATHIRIKLAHQGPLAAVLFTITVTRVGGSGNGVVDAYAANSLGRFTPLNTPANPDGSIAGTVSEPGTAPGAITVGAYVSKFRWDSAAAGTTEKATEGGVDILANPRFGNIHVSSSRGPTRDGRNKPDIAAPGFWIGSTRQIGSVPPASDIDVDTDYVYQSGTSFAAPQVAGIVALLFQKNGGFDQSTIRQFIMDTALNDSQTDNVSFAWGAGKINATGLTGIIKSTVPRHAHNAHCTNSAGGVRSAAFVLLALLLLPLLLRNRA
jgi:subtilisin family serine protease